MPKIINSIENCVEWLSERIPWDQRNDPDFTYRSVDFYDTFRFKKLIASVGDFVLISNADSAEPDTVEGCDFAQIIKLYESHDPDLEDRFRARVQWFTRPSDLPSSQWTNTDQIIFHEKEVIEDHRAFDIDVSIETFFKKCHIIRGSKNKEVHEILLENDTKLLTYVCRYRLNPISKRKFDIVPVLAEERAALELLKTPSNKKNVRAAVTPSSITKRMSRVSISDDKNWSIANTDGMKVLLKKAVLTDSLIKEAIKKNTPQKLESTPQKLEPTPQKVQTAPRRKILLADEISNILSMELDERSDDEVPTLIIRQNEPQTPKRTPKVTSSIVSTPTRQQIDSPSGRTTRSTRKPVYYNEQSPVKQTPKKEISTPTRSIRKRLLSSGDESKVATPNVSRKAIATPSKRSSVLTPSIRLTSITPKHTPRKIVSQLTPSVQMRANPIEDSDSDWDKENTELPGRESQMEEILSFVRSKLQDHASGCMYISGVPGTGKTATVCTALRRLKDEPRLPSFQLVEVNGMKLAEPRQAYVQIYKQLTGKTLAWEQASSLLEKRFTQAGPRRSPTVLLVDELDALCTRRQDVVYSIMEWSSHQSARLTVLAVANTLDLPERALASRVASRLGLTRLTFPPYSHSQLQTIVTVRLRNANVSADAVQLIARKVAAVSGDARRALSLCARAVELGGAGGAGLREVEAALAEAAAGAAARAVRALSAAERLLLRAVATEVERTGSDETTLARALEAAAALVAVEGRGYRAARQRPPTASQALAVCRSLASSRLLLVEHKAAGPRLLLNISADDVHYATRDITV